MVDAFMRGVVAGFGIAIPVGAIAVLIIETGRQWGFRIAVGAGLGAALADFTYAAVAGLVGASLAHLLAAYSTLIHWVSGAVLAAIAVGNLWSALREPQPDARPVPPRPSRLVVTFLGLTLANPLTVTYFAALVASSGRQVDVLSLAAFVAGAFLASFAWQSLLAAIGAFMGRRLPEGTRTVTGVVGSLIVFGLAIRAVVSA